MNATTRTPISTGAGAVTTISTESARAGHLRADRLTQLVLHQALAAGNRAVLARKAAKGR